MNGPRSSGAGDVRLPPPRPEHGYERDRAGERREHPRLAELADRASGTGDAQHDLAQHVALARSPSVVPRVVVAARDEARLAVPAGDAVDDVVAFARLAGRD